MKKKYLLPIVFGISLLFAMFIVHADSNISSHTETFERAKQIIEAKTPCNLLTERDLESLGEYFMEQMHPGEAHEIMDNRIGGEESESLRLAHIGMGSRFYCTNNPETYSNYGMMMENRAWDNYSRNLLSYWFFWWLIAILTIIIMILTILLLIKKLNEKGGRKK